jgi:hypothetical protein
MQVGDLVKWIGGKGSGWVGQRVGLVMGKWVNDSHPDDTTAYWTVFMEGDTFIMDEQYLEVLNESR